MTDEPFDPWKSLASELGVDASEPAPPPPPASTQANVPPRTPVASTSPPKKSASDWIALAGELGIEVPLEAPSAPAKRDPVAELLGFPPPSADEPYGRVERRSIADDEPDEPIDDREDRAPSNRWTSDDRGGEAMRDADEGDEIRRLEAVQDAPPSRRENTERPSAGGRRRRRGGRGRGEPKDRNDERRTRSSREMGRDARLEFSEDSRQEFEASGNQSGEIADDVEQETAEANSPAFESGSEEQRRADDDLSRQKRRRRRGRRGRGGTRDRGELSSERSKPTRSDAQPQFDENELDVTQEEIDFVEIGDDDRPILEPAAVAPDVEDDGAEDLSLTHESHGKNSVRDIMTWKEAIGMIIDGNMQARSRAPQNSQGSQGSHGSRGRGRGRGRGGHRGN